MGRILKTVKAMFRKKTPKGIHSITRWVYKFNKAQVDRDVRLYPEDQYGKPGEEVWSQEEGYYQFDWEKAANAWYTTKELGNYWCGPAPEKEGSSLPATEFTSLWKRYLDTYDLD